MRCYSNPAARVLLLVALAISLPLAADAQRRSARKTQTRAAAARFASGRSALRIPLEIDNNIILMRVSVNNSQPLRFIFDTERASSLAVQGTPAVFVNGKNAGFAYEGVSHAVREALGAAKP